MWNIIWRIALSGFIAPTIIMLLIVLISKKRIKDVFNKEED